MADDDSDAGLIPAPAPLSHSHVRVAALPSSQAGGQQAAGGAGGAGSGGSSATQAAAAASAGAGPSSSLPANLALEEVKQLERDAKALFERCLQLERDLRLELDLKAQQRGDKWQYDTAAVARLTKAQVEEVAQVSKGCMPLMLRATAFAKAHGSNAEAMAVINKLQGEGKCSHSVRFLAKLRWFYGRSQKVENHWKTRLS